MITNYFFCGPDEEDDDEESSTFEDHGFSEASENENGDAV